MTGSQTFGVSGDAGAYYFLVQAEGTSNFGYYILGLIYDYALGFSFFQDFFDVFRDGFYLAQIFALSAFLAVSFFDFFYDFLTSLGFSIDFLFFLDLSSLSYQFLFLVFLLSLASLLFPEDLTFFSSFLSALLLLVLIFFSLSYESYSIFFLLSFFTFQSAEVVFFPCYFFDFGFSSLFLEPLLLLYEGSATYFLLYYFFLASFAFELGFLIVYSTFSSVGLLLALLLVFVYLDSYFLISTCFDSVTFFTYFYDFFSLIVLFGGGTSAECLLL